MTAIQAIPSVSADGPGDSTDEALREHIAAAPRPTDLAGTGLTDTFVAELVVKHLYHGGVMDLRQLTDRLALAGPVLDPVIAFLRNEAQVEVLPAARDGGIRYALTDRGRSRAVDALFRSGYAGPAPVTLEAYRRVVQSQSVRAVTVSRSDAQSAFDDVVAPPSLIDRLGTAVNAGRQLFLYGPPGTGKTHLGGRLVRMLKGDEVLVPYSILVGDTVIRIYDASVHICVGTRRPPGLTLTEEHDPRFVRCRRPEVISGGELTLDMLEVQYDAATKQYRAPPSLMANNGLYMIDDLGRQRVTPDALLNRWIMPMEEGRDFLAIGAAQRFEVPFDVVLIFSTNVSPFELADEAFLRRLGHKIRFDYLEPEQYEEIWKRTCDELGIEFDGDLFARVLRLYENEGRPLLPCHPRDLLTSVVDRLEYEGNANGPVDFAQLQQAWDSYFVPLADDRGHQPEDSQ